jgi:hypothetical protein
VAYTLGDIVNRVQQRIRDTGYSSSEIKTYINDAQNDVFNEYRLPLLEDSQDYTLAAGVSDITNGTGVPTNYVQGLDLLLTTAGIEKPLIYIAKKELDAMYPDGDDVTVNPANIPSYWYVYESTIKVFPVPSDAFTVTLNYYKKPVEMTADGDVPLVPSEFQELLVLGAAYRVMQVKDNYDQAGVLQNKFDEILQKLVSKYTQKQVGTPTIMRINRNGLGKAHF